MIDRLKIAEEALKHWIHAIETGDWKPYISLLTDDYTFWMPEEGFKYKTSDLLASKEQMVKSKLNGSRLLAYKHEPSRISIGNQSVVFEFTYNVDDETDGFENCMALSFDIKGKKIKACREYHSVLMKF